MGEKLGGDYLFDIVYVRKAYEELRQDMETSLGNFGELTRNSYRGLLPVFEHIDSLIRALSLKHSPGQPMFCCSVRCPGALCSWWAGRWHRSRSSGISWASSCPTDS